MDTHLRPGANSMEPQSTRANRRTFSSTAARSMNLRDMFDKDRPCSSHGDDHHRVRNPINSPSPVLSGKHSKQRTTRVKAEDNDELVKHMSNLPSYLERGVKPQEKAFNVGVLDWSLLEKWQSSKQVPYRSDGSSSSNSNPSSIFSTEESSSHSQTGHGSSAAHGRHQQHPVFKFHLKASPSDACTTDDKSSHNVSKNKLESTAESAVREGLGSTSAYPGSHDIASSSKGQRHSELEKEARRSRRSRSMSLNHKSIEKDEKAVLVRPPDGCSVVSVSKGPKATPGQRILEEKEMSCTERSRKAHYPELICDITHSCPLPCDINDKKIRVLRPSMSQEAKTNEVASACPQLHSAGKLISPSKEGSSKENHSISTTALPTVTDLPQRSGISNRTVDVANARYPSPTGRLSLPIGTSCRKSSSTKDAAVPLACTAHPVAKPHTKREVPFTSLEKPSSDTSAAATKARSSPLKRLLEPLLKSREGTNNRSSSPMKKDSKPVGTASMTLDRPSTAPGMRVGLNMNSGKSTWIHKSHQNGKSNDSVVIQALLQVIVQNGCPLFTFAIDGVKDILCAALSKLCTEKKFGDKYLYTFFSIHEPKNKSWINLRSKSSGHDYSPNVVAQMLVSDAQISNNVDHHCAGNNFLRQFVVTTVDLKGEKMDSEYELNDELAAVVVNIPSKSNDRVQSYKHIGTTVILPSGIHTLPSDGKPSSLIERWRSGGHCDCGGWDTGCKLRILTDSKCQSSTSMKFELYDQGEAVGLQPIFNLSPLKDKEGVLSVGFSSSISPLQAFSICLAVLDTKKHSRPRIPAKVQEAKRSDDIIQDKAPGGYFSVPPHSPIGRA